MNTHEYQAKQILLRFGMPVPKFRVIHSLDELKEEEFSRGVVKIQVHAGGRGKAGGVQLAHNFTELTQYVQELLGMKIVNNQTGPSGAVSNVVMVSEAVDIEQEYYLAVLIDRELRLPVLLASKEGGVEIESVPEEKILKLPLRFDGILEPLHEAELCLFMGWEEERGLQVTHSLIKAFMGSDALLFEINPLVRTGSGALTALDAKLSVDDNALFRQREIRSFFDPTQLSKNEVFAKEYDLSYISLEGQVGCMVNGAGLAMATMDTIHHFGGEPANFLDVGGSATKEKVAAGFRIILEDPNVSAILVNIFGGIMNCETIAHGVIEAARELSLTVPLVVRLEGTNSKEGKELIEKSSLSIITADDLADGAKKAVEASRGNTH